MVLALMPGTAFAADSDFVIEDGVLTEYNGPGGDVVIPDSVTSIGDYAFLSCDGLTSVTIPDSVTSIGEYAFAWNYNLTNVTILDGVTSIGVGVFDNCPYLTNVDIPNSVTTIGEGAFKHSGLASVNIPNGVTTIERDTFYYCGLASVTIPDGVTSIGETAFYNCFNLTSVTIPASVTTIGSAAFGLTDGYKNVTDVYYGGSKSQWDQISIGVENEPLLNATIHYSSSNPASPTSNGVSVSVDDKAVTWTDAAPFIDANSRTMVPLRAVADAMGLDVNWDGSAREAVFTNGSKTIYFPIDSNTARTSNGGTVRMDTAAVIVNDRTYAPIRYLAEYFGYEVGWDAATRTVTIK